MDRITFNQLEAMVHNLAEVETFERNQKYGYRVVVKTNAGWQAIYVSSASFENAEIAEEVGIETLLAIKSRYGFMDADRLKILRQDLLEQVKRPKVWLEGSRPGLVAATILATANVAAMIEPLLHK